MVTRWRGIGSPLVFALTAMICSNVCGIPQDVHGIYARFHSCGLHSKTGDGTTFEHDVLLAFQDDCAQQSEQLLIQTGRDRREMPDLAVHLAVPPSGLLTTNQRNALNVRLEVKLFVRELLALLAELETTSIQPADTSSVASGSCACMPRVHVPRQDLPHRDRYPQWLQFDGLWPELLRIKTHMGMSFVSIWHLLIIGMAAAVVWLLPRPPTTPPRI
jgi:hypothetical protein